MHWEVVNVGCKPQNCSQYHISHIGENCSVGRWLWLQAVLSGTCLDYITQFFHDQVLGLVADRAVAAVPMLFLFSLFLGHSETYLIC